MAILFAATVYHCFFAGLSSFGLVGPDEPRYASIAREMARSGDWVTPRLNGEPWFEKPPLYYWTGAICFRVFSNSEVAARVPGGIFAMLAVLAIWLLAHRIYGSAVANTAAWILPATVAMTGFAHAAATDMPFAACLALAMTAAAFLLLDEQPAHRLAWSVVFGVGLGAGVLAKGPAAVLLAGGSVALWAIASGNILRSFRLFHPAALIAFFASALPWYVLCAMRNPGFLRIFLLEHNVERFLTNRYQHQQPFWFFVPVILLAVFPWTLLLVPTIRDGWRALKTQDWRQSPGVYLAAWVIFPFVFFSASQSKLPGYILPAVAPLLLLLARTMSGDPDASARSRLVWPAATLVALGVALLVTASRSPGTFGPGHEALPGLAPALQALGATLCFGCAAIGPKRAGTSTLGAGLAACVFALAVGIAANHLLKLYDPYLSPRSFALKVAEHVGSADVAAYDLPRAWQFGCEFYLQRPLTSWLPDERSGWVITPMSREPIGPARLEVPTVTSPRAVLLRVE